MNYLTSRADLLLSPSLNIFSSTFVQNLNLLSEQGLFLGVASVNNVALSGFLSLLLCAEFVCPFGDFLLLTISMHFVWVPSAFAFYF